MSYVCAFQDKLPKDYTIPSICFPSNAMLAKVSDTVALWSSVDMGRTGARGPRCQKCSDAPPGISSGSHTLRRSQAMPIAFV